MSSNLISLGSSPSRSAEVFPKNLPGWCSGSTRKNEICEDFKQQLILHVKDERIVRFYHPAPFYAGRSSWPDESHKLIRAWCDSTSCIQQFPFVTQRQSIRLLTGTSRFRNSPKGPKQAPFVQRRGHESSKFVMLVRFRHGAPTLLLFQSELYYL